MATARSLANPDSLAVLTDAVNQTLIDTGRFFKSSGSLQSRTHLKTSIPASYQRFQIALDTLSEQIFIAKAYLERDYEIVTARKVAPKLEPAPVSAPAPAPAAIPAPSPPAPAQPTAEDVPMAEAPVSILSEPVKESIEKTEQRDHPIKTEPLAAPDPFQFEEKAEPSTQNAAATERIGTLKAEEITDKGEQPLTLTTGDEMNFDSMLATTGETTNEFDMNFNFTNDEIGNQNFLAGSDFINANPAMAGDANADNGAGSISSLLPGLESYATDSNAGDNFNFDLPKLEDQSLGGQGLDQSNAGQDNLMALGESSFDDLFMEKDNNLEGENSLLGGDLMDLGELDDSWLN
ncbi:hypothetical protein UA08_08888 [Talaromyces atroroseus]|uniref:Uncharacterized protein n=1 Tax=Talaromyces atroroseus TaxID=1441469 RepID=A0A225A692_TALAT|nr:hypothetical protein UA08_08888 [Talaromyces atroroseus]OKL55862.1 hypothetical protein UA08_08888 [Talaromyces atroroseus]